MRVNNKIKSLIDNLTATHLSLGVQPSEIADAIFEDNYKKIETEKKNGIIQMSVTFLDRYNEETTAVIMRYTYNPDKMLMRVEQKVGKRPFKIQWDRVQAINSLITEICNHLGQLNKRENIQRAMDTIPIELRTGLCERLKLVV